MSLIAKFEKILQVRGIFKTLTSLDRVKASQNGTFLYFGVKQSLKTCFSKKKFEKFRIVQ